MQNPLLRNKSDTAPLHGREHLSVICSAILDKLKPEIRDENPQDTYESVLPMLLQLIEGIKLEVSPTAPLRRDGQHAAWDIENAEDSAKHGEYELAVQWQHYAALKFRKILRDLQTGKLAYGYDVCFTADTKIPLLDGTSVELISLVGKDHFWVYSLTDDGMLRPGFAHSARLIEKDAPLLEVELDNGKKIKCTYPERFMLRTGGYKYAQDLAPGDSLMPLYRDFAPIVLGNNEYERTYEPGTDSWKFTHRFAEARCPKGYVRHHKDFNRFNNCPDNFNVITWEAHQKLHQEAGIPATEKARTTRRRNMLKINEDRKGKPRPWAHFPHPWVQHQDLKGLKFGKLEVLLYVGSTKNGGPHWLCQCDCGNQKRICGKSLKQNKTRSCGCSNKERISSIENQKQANRIANHTRWHIDRGMVNPTCQLCVVVNHKVISVKPSGTADVYDFIVDKYHNFALLAGVFVHNSGEMGEMFGGSDEIAKRENQKNIDDTAEPQDQHNTPPNPANMSRDYEAEKEFPALQEFKSKKVTWPPRTR